MAGLDNIPQQQQITIETAKIDADVFKSMQEINQKINALIIELNMFSIVLIFDVVHSSLPAVFKLILILLVLSSQPAIYISVMLFVIT